MAAPEQVMPMRHSLVWVRPGAAWRALEPESEERLSKWFSLGLPTVLARLQGDEPPGHWRLGVPLPPAEGKRRLGIVAPTTAISDWRAPLALHDVLPAAPGDWRPPLQKLLVQTGQLEIETYVYGSLAWQTLTGWTYLTDRSDVDLAWQPNNSDHTEALFDLLSNWEATTGLRADGELLLPNGEGVNWRELASGAKKVLVKSVAAASLWNRDEVMEAFSNHHGRKV